MSQLSAVGAYREGAARTAFDPQALADAIAHVREPAFVVRDRATGRLGLGLGGELLALSAATASDQDLMATLPALYPEWLGDRSFNEVHGVRFPYVAGEMANGIATTQMCVAMARAGMLGFFGAAGLSYGRVQASIAELEQTLGTDGTLPWGVNLIHSPNEQSLEDAVAGHLVERNVGRISASAFMGITPAVVRSAIAGIRLDASGQIVRPRSVFAKISRAEVATRFLSPAPGEILRALLAQGHLTQAEVDLAAHVPIAEDITVEADSGGHTDNQALTALFPTIARLRDEIAAKHGYKRPIRVGAAGGLGTPGALAAAFGLGAAYVVTGSVNQAALEAGLSDEAKAMLATADVPDVTMAPAADMFEMGVKVQVLKRGTMFASRATKLYEVYVSHASIEAMSAETRTRLERDVLHATFDEIWADTKGFWTRRDPEEVARAEADPKHKMALCFRWYLGKASRWAIEGETTRRTDFQIWCGPAMGAFNRWTAGTFLAKPEERGVVQIARNLLEGAAVISRAQQLRSYGVPVPPAAFEFRPRPLSLALLRADVRVHPPHEEIPTERGVGALHHARRVDAVIALVGSGEIDVSRDREGRGRVASRQQVVGRREVLGRGRLLCERVARGQHTNLVVAGLERPSGRGFGVDEARRSRRFVQLLWRLTDRDAQRLCDAAHRRARVVVLVFGACDPSWAACLATRSVTARR